MFLPVIGRPLIKPSTFLSRFKNIFDTNFTNHDNYLCDQTNLFFKLMKFVFAFS
jgi:hypothetical protein